MNTVETPTTVYPTFQQQKKQLNAIDTIDDSIYHLLSLYLNTNTVEQITNNHSHKNHKYPHNSLISLHQRQNWFGENKRHHQDDNDLLLRQNTLRNINIPPTTTSLIKRKKSKSVSFNETVTVISSSQDNISQTSLIFDEDIFVDAVESFE